MIPSADGLLLVDKPLGPTSTDIVRDVRRVFGTREVGHAGTLDPTATGLLLVCVGEATKLVPHLMAAQKVYEAVVRFGAETVTDDAEGAVRFERPVPILDAASLDSALRRFEGVVLQAPPRVSAIKQDGRRMHDRTRAGEDVEERLIPREVIVHALEVLGVALPELTLRATVGKGFYVRSLARDLGRMLDSAAHLTALRRTRIGAFAIADAVTPEALDRRHLRPLGAVLNAFPRAIAEGRTAERLRNGNAVPLADVRVAEPGTSALVVVAEGEPIAMGELRTTEAGPVLVVTRGFRPGAAVPGFAPGFEPEVRPFDSR